MASAIARTLRALGLSLACAAPVAHAQCPVQQLLPSPLDRDTEYGWYVDLEGDTAAVFQFHNAGPKTATFIYQRKEGFWRLGQRLKASWSALETQWGPLALEREWLAVGIPTYNPSGVHAHGGVQTYQRTATGWDKRELLFDPLLGIFGSMGSALSLTDRHLAVGSYSGYAYVYELQQPSGSSWKLMAKLPDPAGFTHQFGWSVAVDETTLVVGAPAVSWFTPGAAYVYELIQGSWQLVRRLQPDDLPYGASSFGNVAALSGSHCFVGSPNLGGQAQGFVYSFEKRGDSWEFTQVLRPLDHVRSQFFGQAISLSGDHALIAAAGPGAARNACVAYHFHFRDGIWLQIGKLVLESTRTDSPNESLLADVALSGTTALLSAPEDILSNGSAPPPQGIAFAFELGPDSLQYCVCSQDHAPCGAADGDAGCTNSSGHGAMLSACGSGSVTTDDLRMESRWMPQDVLGLVVMGPRPDETPYGDGILCVGPGDKGVFRFSSGDSGPRGRIALGPGIVAYSHENFPASGHIQPGDTWYFQAWYRDADGPCGTGFNLSNGVKVDFTQ